MDFIKNPPSLSKIILGFFTGFSSGLIGTLVSAIILFLSWSIVGDSLNLGDEGHRLAISLNDESSNPLLLQFVVLAIFLGSLVGSLVFVIFLGLTQSRYKNKTTILTHVFFGNLFILLMFLPVYIIFDINISNSFILVGFFHILTIVVFSMIVTEIQNLTVYFLVHLYGVVLGIVILLLIGGQAVKTNYLGAIFLTMPIIFASISVGNLILQAFYSWFYKNYGNDFLNLNTKFGSDYSKKLDKNK